MPLVLEFRGSPQRVFLGQFAASSAQFYEGDSARKSLLSPTQPNPDAAIRPTAAHWALALAITIAASFVGYLTALAWFTPPAA
ncbi:MAG: hypothetical protein ACKVOG_03275 [Rhodoglobus sp.]